MRKYVVICFLVAGFLACASAFGASDRIDPPQDQGKMHLSIVGNANDPTFRTVTDWFYDDWFLMHFREEVHYHEVTTNTEIFRERYEPNIAGLPTIRLQRADGVVIYESWDLTIPDTPEELALCLHWAVFASEFPWRNLDWFLMHCREPEELALCLRWAIFVSKSSWRNLDSEQCNPWKRCCPRPKPKPEPEPEPTVTPEPEVVVIPEEESPDYLWLKIMLVLTAITVGVAIGVAYEWKKTHGA